MSDPYINGWAIASDSSVAMHAVPFPTDIADDGPALCQLRPSARDGWIEPNDVQRTAALYCSQCMHLYKLMYEDNDPRLTTEDRRRLEHAIDAINRR